MSAQPTGTGEVRDGQRYLVYHRQFTAPADRVWDTITHSDRMADWFGEQHRVVEKEPGQRLVSEPGDGEATGRVELDLSEHEGVTRLVVAQPVEGGVDLEQVGPRWDYRLDRLARAVGGDDVSVVDFDDYYPALSGHYRDEFG